LFGAPDYALLGIGAYKPRWFMQANHISPYDSLTAASQMKARITIPMHYGTFDLSDEPLSDPPAVFARRGRQKEYTGKDSGFRGNCKASEKMIYKFLLYENNFITYRIFYFFSYDSM